MIDNNPVPISGIFKFTTLSGRADIETRIRIDEFTHVRVIAETQDGQLFMTTRFIKASGGCSAPPGKDMQAAKASLGRMKLRVEDLLSAPGQPVLAQLMISHPNSSGLAMDPLTRLYAPSHFVRHINVTYQGQLVMSSDIDISISENPNLRFYFVPQSGGDGELKAVVVDSEDAQYQTSLQWKRAP